ncbi:MAG: hypothetical protein RL266_544 [Bacteroidota bacterium]
MVVIVGMTFNSTAQSTASDSFEEKIKEMSVPGAVIGSLVCENANGDRVLCSGSVEETVLGIVTNLPYITLNKPATREASKYIFEACVDASTSLVAEGTYLIPGKGGKLVPTSDASIAYAVALDAASSSNAKIRVKVLSK